MPRQRDIREKALAFLFAHDASHALTTDNADAFWALALEPELEKLRKLTVKTLIHQLQSCSKTTDQLADLTDVIAPMLKTYELKSEARQLLALNKLAAKLNQRTLLLGKQSTAPELHTLATTAQELSVKLSSLQTTLSTSGFSDPSMPKLDKALIQMRALATRIAAVTAPLDHPDDPAVKPLHKIAQDLQQLRDKATQLAQGTLDHIEPLDEALATHLQYYSSKTIGKVERTLLRLSAHEIITLQTPKPIVINESLELARKYCTEDAVPLLNGVLDNLA